MKRILINAILFFAILFQACSSKSKKIIVQDVQLEEVKQEETMDEPTFTGKSLTCADSVSLETGFLNFCKKQPPDPSLLRCALTVIELDSSCFIVVFSRVDRAPTDTARGLDTAAANRGFLEIAVARARYHGLNKDQVISQIGTQIKEIAATDTFKQMPMYASRSIVFFTENNQQITLK